MICVVVSGSVASTGAISRAGDVTLPSQGGACPGKICTLG
jgi:hypothetical protein